MMRLPYILSVVAWSSLTLTNAQDCANGRYTTPLFADVTVTAAVPFGMNSAVAGGMQTLYMDVYEPTGDVATARPVVLVAFGGSFVAGSRADVAALCIDFAKRGYVAIAPDYRIGFFLPNELSTSQAVMRGAHDMKACVRYLRRSVAELNDPYRIDVDRIIVGGISAGAISALHATYLNTDDEIPTILEPLSAQLGGVEGNSGNPGYSSEVLACYSLSGAIGDTSWILPNDRPLCSVHEVGDAVVPYYTQEVYVFGLATGLIASGSHDIHERLQDLSVPNCFLSYPGNGHVGYLTSDPIASLGFVYEFCAGMVCGLEENCGTLFAGVEEPTTMERVVFGPNPTQGPLNIQSEAPGRVSVLDASGRTLLSGSVRQGTNAIDLTALPAGVYMVRIEGTRPSTGRVVKVD